MQSTMCLWKGGGCAVEVRSGVLVVGLVLLQRFFGLVAWGFVVSVCVFVWSFVVGLLADIMRVCHLFHFMFYVPGGVVFMHVRVSHSLACGHCLHRSHYRRIVTCGLRVFSSVSSLVMFRFLLISSLSFCRRV